jgi:hypothetical protein
MRLVLILFIAAAAVAVTAIPLFGAESCDMQIDPAVFHDIIASEALFNAPVKYHDIALSVKLVTVAGVDPLIPHATMEKGTRIVTITPQFARVACKLAFTTFMINHGSSTDGLDAAASIAATCLDKGGVPQACISEFADLAWAKYQQAFAALDAVQRGTASALYKDMIRQLIAHEYAHHYLGHLSRLREGSISRSDAEFEADFFAVMSGVESGDPPIAMIYLFDPLAAVERRTSKLVTDRYESARCRSGNVMDIYTAIGEKASLIMLDATRGSHHKLRVTPPLLRSEVMHETGGPFTLKNPSGCGRLSATTLASAHDESRQLYGEIAKNADLLLGKEFTPQKALSLVRSISSMARNFKHLNGCAARAVSQMIWVWELDNKTQLPALYREVADMLEEGKARGNFLSGDYGRLLDVRADDIFYHRKDLSVESKMVLTRPLYERATFYNDRLAEGWMKLAFFSFKHGDCAAAQRYAEHGIDSAEEALERVRKVGELFKQLAQVPSECKKRGRDFKFSF